MTSEVLDKVIQLMLMMAAFGLVAALAWNEAIQELFTAVFVEAGGIYARSFYAIVVTVVVVFVTRYHPARALV